MRLLGILVLLCASSAMAQGADPTKPPVAWLTPSDSTVPGQADSGAMRLQSVKIPQRGKPVAVIGGKTVVLGERVGEARLIRLSEREAVLQGADGVTHLYLTPEVEKQMIATPQSRKAGKSGHVKGMP
jgi:MSHA biogenesis protein MshK